MNENVIKLIQQQEKRMTSKKSSKARIKNLVNIHKSLRQPTSPKNFQNRNESLQDLQKIQRNQSVQINYSNDHKMQEKEPEAEE